MKIIKSLSLSFGIAALVAAGAMLLHAQMDLNGFWVFRVPTGDGNFRETFFDLKQEGTKVSGKTLQGRRENPLEGTFEKGKLHLVVNNNFNGQVRQMVYEGTVADGKINLESVPGARPANAPAGPGGPGGGAPGGPGGTGGFGPRPPMKGLLERSSPEAAKPPAKLPVPALHNVPDNGLTRTPPMGWNSWNKFAGRVTDADVRGMSDAMVSSGMSKVGYTYINIDDTWEGPRDAQGNITTNKKFPDMKALTDYVHGKGLKVGIYSSPGPKTCAGYEGSFGHEEQDAKQYAAWGFDYLKYDWCSAREVYENSEMQAVYQKMGEALQKTGRPIVFSLCQYGDYEVWDWGAKVGGNLWRTTGDIRDNWASMDKIGFAQFANAKFAKPGHFNDPDMLEIGNGGMSDDEYRTHMSLWSLLASPLLAGNDIRSMTETTKSILMNTEVIAVDQDRAVLPVKKVSEQGAQVVAAREMADGRTVIGLFNRGEEPVQMTADFTAAGVKTSPTRLRDLWAHKEVNAEGGRYTATVPKHGVVLLRVAAK